MSAVKAVIGPPGLACESIPLDMPAMPPDTPTTVTQSQPLRSIEELSQYQRQHKGINASPLGQILLNRGAITEEQLAAALMAQHKKYRRLGTVLQEQGVISHEQVLLALSERFGAPYVVLSNFECDPNALSCLQARFARDHRVLPLLLDGERLVVAMTDPTDNELVNLLRFLTGKVLELCIADSEDLSTCISRHYDSREVEKALGKLSPNFGDHLHAEPFKLNAESETALGHERPVVQLVQNVISDAMMRSASDIHFRPREHEVELLFRVDGVLQHIRSFSKHFLPAVVSRIKIIGNMDISEHRLPQDGRSRLHYQNRNVDLRLSIIPTIHGESVVIRLLDTRFALKNLESLGFEDNDALRLRHLLSRTSGILLVTGPTGSGKSTTLYTALDHIRASNVNIITVEDPVEYHIDGITQIQVNHGTGYSFARALRHILRHDPDVIMVGEIRDQETAKMAVESALTGHLVLSTLHTNDAASTVTRLIEIGIEPYLVSSALIGVLAQRLVRCNCPHCKQPESVDADIRRELGVGPDEVFWQGAGCEHCHHTGVKGRMAVYELLEVTPELQRLMVPGVSAVKLEACAVHGGMTPLTQRALAAAREGRIALKEVYRIRL